MTYEEWESIPKLSHACQHVNCNHCTGRRFETSTEDDCPCKCHKKKAEVDRDEVR